MPEQDELKKEPAKAFEEHLTLPKDIIEDIKLDAQRNTNANMQQNEDQPDEPEMVRTEPPVE